MQETTTSTHHHASSFVLLLTLFILFLHLPSTTADVKTVKIINDNREMIEFEDFGFTKNGHVSIKISSVSVTTTNATTAESPTNSSALGFFIAPITTQVSPDTCILDNPQVTIISTLAGLSPPPQSSLHKTINVTKPDQYVIVFANCVPQTSVSMLVHFESYNLDSNGKKDYLPDGETQLPALYFTLSLCYIPFLIIWIHLCQKNKPFINKIHILMAILLAMKALNLLFAAEDKYHVKTTGTPRGWELLFYTFRSIRALLLFTVTVLIGTGWSFLKPFLQDKEKNILMFGIPLQVFVNIAFVMVEESGPSAKNYEFWLTGFAFVDIICCFVIMIPVTWSIRTLRETSKLDGRAATNLKKLRLFRDFYIALVIYMYFTRYSIYFLRLYFDYKNQWFCSAIVETATLGFYVVMYYLFQPQERNKYFALSLDDKEEEAALTAIQSAEFADY